MSFLVPVMMFGWVPLTIIFFNRFHPRKAVLFSVIGGVLFLPMMKYNIPGLPTYNKTIAISIGILLGGIITNHKNDYPIKLHPFDIPMLIWCFFTPIATSLSNGLGLYEGISTMLENFLIWGVFYWAGRKYFYESSALREISIGIIAGGLIYLPLCIFEIRMSPQLSNIFYGFFPHSFLQHIRYGHYRPIVFMQHGLMVSLWMTSSFLTAFWLWRNKDLVKYKNIPMPLIVISLFVITILTYSMNAWSYLILGILCWLIFNKTKKVRPLLFLLLIVPSYIFFRANNIIAMDDIVLQLSKIFDESRIQSLVFRLNQEDLYSVKALQRMFLGWGGWNRGTPINPRNGKLLTIVDSLWLIVYSKFGMVGLTSLFSALLVGPWSILKRYKKNSTISIDSIIISLIIILFMIDNLLNAMINSVYIVCSGALLSYYLHNSINKDEVSQKKIEVINHD